MTKVKLQDKQYLDDILQNAIVSFGENYFTGNTLYSHHYKWLFSWPINCSFHILIWPPEDLYMVTSETIIGEIYWVKDGSICNVDVDKLLEFEIYEINNMDFREFIIFNMDLFRM